MSRLHAFIAPISLWFAAMPCFAQGDCSACPRCPCRADFDRNGVLNSSDFFQFLGVWFSGASGADYTCNDIIDSEDFFCYVTDFFEGCADVGVTDVRVPSGGVCGSGTTTATVTIANHALIAVEDVELVVRFGSSETRMTVDLPNAASHTIAVPIDVPPCMGNGCNNFMTTLEASLDADCTPSDNTFRRQVTVVGRRWNLEYSIIEEPATAGTGTTIRYTVRVVNTGDRASPRVDSRTAICLNASCTGVWDSCIINCGHAAPVLFEVDPLDPGEIDEIEVSYNICCCCNVCLGRQYIKAGPNEAIGECGDTECASDPICIFARPNCPGVFCAPPCQ